MAPENEVLQSELPLWYVMQTNADKTRTIVGMYDDHSQAHHARKRGAQQWLRPETYDEMQARLVAK